MYENELVRSFNNNLNLLQGYDFAFLRISRLYEECSVQTQYKWTTQYIGGNKLAVCNGKVVFY